jgi:hypothetical protein
MIFLICNFLKEHVMIDTTNFFSTAVFICLRFSPCRQTSEVANLLLKRVSISKATRPFQVGLSGTFLRIFLVSRVQISTWCGHPAPKVYVVRARSIALAKRMICFCFSAKNEKFPIFFQHHRL